MKPLDLVMILPWELLPHRFACILCIAFCVKEDEEWLDAIASAEPLRDQKCEVLKTFGREGESVHKETDFWAVI